MASYVSPTEGEQGHSGWVLPLTQFKVDTSQFFQTEVDAGTFNNTLYAMPWFDNPEGLFYRTDLIKTPPTSPAEVVSDAQAAMKADPSLKEGIAFEADKYEGAITSFLTVDSAFGGTLDPSNVNTPGNVHPGASFADVIELSAIWLTWAPESEKVIAVRGWRMIVSRSSSDEGAKRWMKNWSRSGLASAMSIMISTGSRPWSRRSWK